MHHLQVKILMLHQCYKIVVLITKGKFVKTSGSIFVEIQMYQEE